MNSQRFNRVKTGKSEKITSGNSTEQGDIACRGIKFHTQSKARQEQSTTDISASRQQVGHSNKFLADIKPCLEGTSETVGVDNMERRNSMDTCAF